LAAEIQSSKAGRLHLMMCRKRKTTDMIHRREVECVKKRKRKKTLE
jgi:hypothetical protein